MPNKPFFLFIFLLIIGQVVFSFYYSSEIINQNSLINSNQSTLQTLKIKNQELEVKLAISSSLTQIEASASQKKYINLEKSLDIKN